MDEIDAAVEDAEYVRAMRDGIPQPVKSWEWLSGSDLDQYIERLRKVDESQLSLELILRNNLGFYKVTYILPQVGVRN